MGEIAESTSRPKLRQNILRNKIVRMRNRGERIKTIAAAVGLSVRGVEWHLAHARAAGLLVDATEMLDVFAMPLSVDAYLEALDPDKADLEMRVAVATKVMNGRGVLKTHNKSESNTQAAMSLTIHIDQPTDRDMKDISAIMGEVVGEPRQIKATAKSE